MLTGRDIKLFIAMSLDGYIAASNDSIDFLSMVEEEGQDYGYTNFMNGVDTVVMGRKTYDKVLSMGIAFPHPDKTTYVVTRKPRPDIGNVKFYAMDPIKLVQELKSSEGKDVFVDGGAMLVNTLLKHNLIDTFCISIIPVLLGGGLRLFENGLPELPLKLVEAISFDKGLVQLRYARIGK
ncbi:MAG TPA: dihydrofolate reductase family protein [Paludibacter sp.]|nr:dihydrofolate reductase family protein [Paludibacter sp.]